MTAEEAYLYFVKRAQASARAIGKTVVGWEEIWRHFGTQLDKSTIIHQWLPNSTVAANASAHGYRVLWSNCDCWYLDWTTFTVCLSFLLHYSPFHDAL